MGLRLCDIHFGTRLFPNTGEGIFSPLWWLFSLNGFVETFLWTIFWILIASMFSGRTKKNKRNLKPAHNEALVTSTNNFLHKLIAGNIGVLGQRRYDYLGWF